jgi:hypothetical protein
MTNTLLAFLLLLCLIGAGNNLMGYIISKDKDFLATLKVFVSFALIGIGVYAAKRYLGDISWITKCYYLLMIFLNLASFCSVIILYCNIFELKNKKDK